MGYQTVKYKEELARLLTSLLEVAGTTALFSNFCYTQFADTFQEANGLLYEDRAAKIPLARIAAAVRGEAPPAPAPTYNLSGTIVARSSLSRAPGSTGGDRLNIPPTYFIWRRVMATKSKSAKRPNKRPEKQAPDATELLVLELQEIHSAENQLARAAPRMVKAAESEKLQQMLQLRIDQGAQLIQDVESALEEMEQSPGRKKNVAAEGLINDAREHVQEIEAGPALDAVLIAAIQKTEHYCIAAWGTSRALAEALGQETVVKAMERALKEGKSLDEQLTELAEQEITPQLMSEADEEEEEEEAEEEEEEEEAKPSRSKRGSGSERRAPN